MPSASRKLPEAERAIVATAPSSTSISSAAATRFSTSEICSSEGRWKSKRWQRSAIVAITLCDSVVARTKTVFGGGSSSVLRKAFQASLVSMCASSRM